MLLTHFWVSHSQEYLHLSSPQLASLRKTSVLQSASWQEPAKPTPSQPTPFQPSTFQPTPFQPSPFQPILVSQALLFSSSPAHSYSLLKASLQRIQPLEQAPLFPLPLLHRSSASSFLSCSENFQLLWKALLADLPHLATAAGDSVLLLPLFQLFLAAVWED